MASTARIDELKKKFDENPRRYFAPLANEFRKSGDIEQAIIICEEFLPQQPGHMSGHIVYGQALYEAGRMPESRTVFETALGLDPENLIALRHLGDIARGQGEAAAARSWYLRVLDADPRNEEIQALIASLDGTPAVVKEEEEAELTFAPRPAPEAAAAPVNPLGIEQEQEPLAGSAETVVVEAIPPAPVEPTTVVMTPPAGVDLLDGFSLTGMEGSTARAEDEPAAHAPAEGFETTSFTPPEEPVSSVADLDDSLDSGVPSFEAPAAPVEALDGLQGGASVEHEPLPESPAPVVEGLTDDLTVDDGQVLPPQGDPLATPISSAAIPRTFSSNTPTAPMPAWPRPDDWPAAEARPEPTAEEFEVVEMAAVEPAPEPAPELEPAPEPEPELEPEMQAEPAANVYQPAAAQSVVPAELPPAVISAEAELLEESGMLPPAVEDLGADVPAAAPFVTETMAELYMAQGFPEQARAVYVQLLEAKPHDERLQGLVASLDAQVVEDNGPTVREFFSRMASRRPASRASDVPPADDDFASPAPVMDAAPLPEPELPELAMEEVAPPADEPATLVNEPPAPRSSTPGYVPEVVAPAIERAAAMRTPSGSIDALFGNRAAGTSEDSAASALAQAFGATAEEEPSIVGRPARAATAELSLDSVFRDGGARPPRTSQSFSFDQFFAGGDAKSVSGPRNSGELGAAEAPAERSSEDIEQFNSWLQGLKPR